MTLEQFLRNNKMKLKTFAESIGMSASHMYQISEGHRRPGTAATQLIYLATLGMVSEEDYVVKIKHNEVL